MNDIRLTAR